MRRVMVRYKVKPGQVAANEQLVHEVYEELSRTQPDGFHYGTFKLEDGVSFVHIASQEGEQNPLADVPAFQRFQAKSGDRCDEPPVVAVWMRWARSVSTEGRDARNRDEGGSVAAEDAAAHLRLRDVPRRAGRNEGDRLHRRQDDPPLRRARDRRPPGDACTHGDWIELGSADEQKPAKEGTVEAWGRSADNPVGGWYGLKKGLRGRFGMYMPPLLEELGLADVEHNPRNNRMRAR